MIKAAAALLPLLLAAGCEGPGPIPMKPTWVDDVEPILHGNCFHCHGPEKRVAMIGADNSDAARWDFFFDNTDPQLMALGFSTMDGFRETKTEAIAWPLYVAPTMAVTARMPPAPALPLTDRERTTLERFKNAPTRGMRAGNNKPSAEWKVPGATFSISDADADQVLGTIECGGILKTKILRSGLVQVPAGGQRPCKLALYDGQDLVTVDLP
jgi:hypothetical protein